MMNGEAQVRVPCPLAETDDKYQESHYSLESMMRHYHDPEPFRWNLNAFLQALRSVTFFIQKTLARTADFEAFWATQQESMRADPLLRRFVEGRNVVVKQRKAILGVFNYRCLRVGMSFDVPAHVPSRYLLEQHARALELIGEMRDALWEEYGVERQWYAPELGEGEILVLCDDAWMRISRVRLAAHQFMSWHCAIPEAHHHRPEKCNLLTETDVNPELAREWGWSS
jgi:hypothetical protein